MKLKAKLEQEQQKQKVQVAQDKESMENNNTNESQQQLQDDQNREMNSSARMQLQELAKIREARRLAQQDAPETASTNKKQQDEKQESNAADQIQEKSHTPPIAATTQVKNTQQIYEEVKYDPNKEGLELNSSFHSSINRNNRPEGEDQQFQPSGQTRSPHFGHVGRPQYHYDTGGTINQQNQPGGQRQEFEQMQPYGATNFMGHPYRDLRLDGDINMTNAQTVLFVILNFSMAVMLLVAVNCNMQDPCGSEMKYWLIIFSLVLGLGSLVAVMGMDIDRQRRLMRQIHNGCKLTQYIISVCWLLYGNYIAFIDGDTCPRKLPWLSMTMMVTLFFGWIQLIMFFVFMGGIFLWAMGKLCGRETNFTPQSLWRDQQQFFDRDPEHTVNEQNKQILSKLEELVFGQYRREVNADMKYGFVQGDPNYWREQRSNESSFEQVDDMGLIKRVGRPECAICMERFNEQDLISPLPCHVNHLFHTACIRPWLLQNRNCPLCKREVDPIELTNVSGSFMMNQTITNTNTNNTSQMSLSNARQQFSSSCSSNNRINLSHDNANARISGQSSNGNDATANRPFQRYV